MKIGVRTHHGEDEALMVAEQIGADGASLWISAFEGFRREYLPTIAEISAMRERFEQHHLMWTGLGIVCEGFMKNQLLGLPGRDEEIDKFCEIIRRVGVVYQDVPASETPVMIIDQRPTYWAPSSTSSRRSQAHLREGERIAAGLASDLAASQSAVDRWAPAAFIQTGVNPASALSMQAQSSRSVEFVIVLVLAEGS